MSKQRIIAVAFGAALAANYAHATTLSGDLSADNAFYAYLSTSPDTLGTFQTNGNYWGQAYSFTSSTLPNQTLYLNIEVINTGGPGAFLGTFTLSDPNFQFANGTQTDSTGLGSASETGWYGSYNSSNSTVSPQTWVVPTGGVLNEAGYNGARGEYPYQSSIWYYAEWIWPNDALSSACVTGSGLCTVDFSTTISYTGPSDTPLPAALPLFATGLGAMGLLGWRRKRKAGGSLAAA